MRWVHRGPSSGTSWTVLWICLLLRACASWRSTLAKGIIAPSLMRMLGRMRPATGSEPLLQVLSLVAVFDYNVPIVSCCIHGPSGLQASIKSSATPFLWVPFWTRETTSAWRR